MAMSLFSLHQSFPSNVCSVSGVFKKTVRVREIFLSTLDRPLDFMLVVSDSYCFNFEYFVDEFGLDSVSVPKRFCIKAYLRSFAGLPLFISSRVSLKDPRLISLESYYPGSNWAEREVFDMFGIFFRGHTDLRRLLTDYGFEGYPLRKDFPVSGYHQIRYSDLQRRLIFEPVEFALQYRSFKFNSSWSNCLKYPI